MNITPEDLKIIDALPKQKRELFYHKLRAVEAVIDRQRGSMSGEVSRQAKHLGVSPSAINRWISAVRNHGPTGLIDRRN